MHNLGSGPHLLGPPAISETNSKFEFGMELYVAKFHGIQNVVSSGRIWGRDGHIFIARCYA